MPPSAIVLNGARIGKNSVVGAGAVVTENKEFPDNSLIVGAPARVLRPLDDRLLQVIAESFKIYVAKSRLYAAKLKRIG